MYCTCRVIQFLGAFYREGAVTIITEYMDGGSLLNVLQQVNIHVSCLPASLLLVMIYIHSLLVVRVMYPHAPTCRK